MLRRLFLACAAATLMAQAPVISFDKVHHDFGRITPDRKVSAKYRVTNTGNAYLSITQVRPSCGCTYHRAREVVPRAWGIHGDRSHL